jgi:hypothetical protein
MVTAVVIASPVTRATRSRSSSRTRTTSGIKGKIVSQVRSAILYGGGGDPGLDGRVSQLLSPVR